jgi:hypothetical protein
VGEVVVVAVTVEVVSEVEIIQTYHNTFESLGVEDGK